MHSQNSLLIAYVSSDYHSSFLLQYNPQHADILYCFLTFWFLSRLTIQLSLSIFPNSCALAWVWSLCLCSKEKDAGHCQGRRGSFPNRSCVSFYWCLPNHFKHRGLKPHMLTISQLPWIRSWGMAKRSPLLRVAQDSNQLCYVLNRSSTRARSTSILP